MSRHHPAHPDYYNPWLRAGVVFDPTGGVATMALAAVAVGGMAANVIGTIAQGNAQRGELDYQARQEAAKSKADFAAGSMAAANQARVGEFALSRGQAVAAASGATTTSPSVENIEEQVAGNNEYNVLSQVFQGQERANSDTQQELNDYYMGKQAKYASDFNALSIIGKSGSSMMQNYGDAFVPSNPDPGGLLNTTPYDSNSFTPPGMTGPFQQGPLPWQQ